MAMHSPLLTGHRAFQRLVLRTLLGLSLALLGLVALAACGPSLTPAGASIRVVSKEDAAACEELGPVEGLGQMRIAHAHPGEASGPNLARNQVATLGGDAMWIRTQDWPVIYGAWGMRYRTQAVALRCGS